MLTLLVNGEPAMADDLLHLAVVNYGCFTSMQAEQGADGRWGVRGLGLHLDRLQAGAEDLFGAVPDMADVRRWMGQALDGYAGRASLRVNLFSRALSVRNPAGRVVPDALVMAAPPAAGIAGPFKLAVERHARARPHLKHVATFFDIAARRAALDAGHDDVLYVDETGRISEGAIWNIGFLTADTVVWPEAPMLAGTGQALIQKGLEALELATERRRIDLSELATFDAAFVTNSAMIAVPVSAVGGVRYPERPDLIQLLKTAWASNPLQTI